MNAVNKIVGSQGRQPPEPWIALPGTTVGGEAGIFSVDFTTWNRDKTRSRTLNGVVDTGASYAVAPASSLEEMGIDRRRARRFTLADGSTRELSIGWVEMELLGETDNVPVILGSDRHTTRLGSMTLETFALAADAKNHCLIPAELTLY